MFPSDSSDSPNWAFSTSEGITCPECSAAVTGVNYLNDGTHTTGMQLFPCNYQLPSPPWQLGETGQRGGLELKKVST